MTTTARKIEDLELWEGMSAETDGKGNPNRILDCETSLGVAETQKMMQTL